MKTVIVYYSRFGHTRKLAEAMAEQLLAEGVARAVEAGQVTAADLQGADLVMMGSPTHRMRLPEDLGPLLDALQRGCLGGTAVAAFDTSYRMGWFLARFTAAKSLDRRLRKLGGRRIAPPQTFFMAAREGPLAEGEVARAEAWASSLATAVRGRIAGSGHAR